MSSRRVTLVADELLGYAGSGGLGTATSFLALGLARLGHRIEILYVGASTADPEWTRRYAEAGVRVRMLRRRNDPVEPSYFARPREIALELRDDPPDVVIVQDLGAPGYVALRLRQLGLAFENTLFVVFCHGTRRWITDVTRKVRVLPGALGVTMLEQASLELADLVVSPSSYMVEWMRRQRWQLPETHVIPYVTSTAATGEAPARVPAGAIPIDRIAFFGRLDERKGVRLFVAALNALEPALLERIEVVFVGRPAPITPAQIDAMLSPETSDALRDVSFEPGLAQSEALELIGRPGTLAIMPSLEDNSPNTVYECLERGIRFMASDAGGTRELIAPDDRQHVLFEPTAAGVEAALRRALAEGLPRVARPAFDGAASLRRWSELVAAQPAARPTVDERPAVDVIVCTSSRESPCLAALARQTYGDATVISSEDRRDGLQAGTAAWVVFLDEDDVPEDHFVETLVRAQSASGADVVTCGVYVRGDDAPQHYFLGEPGGLGVLANGYGAAALVRRSLLVDEATPWAAEGDPDWPLLAGLTTAGARIVSIPAPLLTRATPPGTLEQNPADALLVAQQLERALPGPLESVARLAAGLAAEAHGAPRASANGALRRARAVLREQGLIGLARVAGRRAARRLPGRSR